MSNFATLPFAGRLLLIVAVLHLAAAWFAGLPEIVLAALALVAAGLLLTGIRALGWIVMLALIVAIGARAGGIVLPPVPPGLDIAIAVLDGIAVLGIFGALWEGPEHAG